MFLQAQPYEGSESDAGTRAAIEVATIESTSDTNSPEVISTLGW